MVNIGVFKEQRECTYKGETYLVRDNGSVCRKHREGKKKRKLDDVWTFGTRDERGYLFISGVQVHRIVATAFLGEAPSEQHVIDHKDTNQMRSRMPLMYSLSCMRPRAKTLLPASFRDAPQ